MKALALFQRRRPLQLVVYDDTYLLQQQQRPYSSNRL